MRDELTHVDEAIKVDTGLVPEPVQQIDHILRRHIARRALRIRTSTQTSHTRVHTPDAQLHRLRDVGDGLSVGVVAVDRQLVRWDPTGVDRFDECADRLRRAHTNRVTQGDLILGKQVTNESTRVTTYASHVE